MRALNPFGTASSARSYLLSRYLFFAAVAAGPLGIAPFFPLSVVLPSVFPPCALEAPLYHILLNHGSIQNVQIDFRDFMHTALLNYASVSM